MFLPFNSVSEWSVRRERIIPFTTTGSVAYGTNIDGQYAVGIFTGNGTITAKDNTTLNIICVGGGGGGASSNSTDASTANRYGGGGGGVVIVGRDIIKDTVYDVTIGTGGAAQTVGSNSSISNVATNFIVQGDGGGRGTTSGAGGGGRGHPYSINGSNPITGGVGSGSTTNGNTKISTATTQNTSVTSVVRPQFIGPAGTLISILTIVPPAVKAFDSRIFDHYAGGGGNSTGRPTPPANPGGQGTSGGTTISSGRSADNGISASAKGSGGGGAGANLVSSGASYVGGSGAPGIVIVWAAY